MRHEKNLHIRLLSALYSHINITKGCSRIAGIHFRGNDEQRVGMSIDTHKRPNKRSSLPMGAREVGLMARLRPAYRYLTATKLVLATYCPIMWFSPLAHHRCADMHHYECHIERPGILLIVDPTWLCSLHKGNKGPIDIDISFSYTSYVPKSLTLSYFTLCLLAGTTPPSYCS